jgi:hypothetical protein
MGGRVIRALKAWWFAALPLGRVAALRTAVYLFVVIDVLYVRAWVADHGTVPGALYEPLLIARLLHLPTPTPLLVTVVKVVLVVAALVAATGRWPRLAGWTVFLLYLEWQLIAFSYGKVDHDRFALLVALLALPTVGRARWGQRTGSEAAGWALRLVMVAAMLTYLLSAIAKLRYGGIEWLNSATVMRAVLRRGTMLTDPFQDHPWVFVVVQHLIFAFEIFSPLLLVPGRVGRAYLVGAYGFHLMNLLTIGIAFWPQLVCLLAFTPLERFRLPSWARAPGARASPAERPSP